MPSERPSIFGLSADGRRLVTVQCDSAALGWLAGLLEGEGSFLSGPPSKPNLPRISIHMADLDVLQKVGALFGVSVFAQKQRPAPHHEVIYSCLLIGSRAVALMVQLRPLMGMRRQAQIDKALASYKAPKSKIYPTVAQILEHVDCSTNAIAHHYGVSHSYVTKLLAQAKKDQLLISEHMTRKRGRQAREKLGKSLETQ